MTVSVHLSVELDHGRYIRPVLGRLHIDRGPAVVVISSQAEFRLEIDRDSWSRMLESEGEDQ